MSKLQLFRRMLRASRNPNQIGDFALLKLELFGGMRPAPGMLERMRDVIGYHPAIDLDTLAELAPGTLGHELARFMRQNKLRPFNISPDLHDIARRHAVGLRVLVTHDIVHTLLGFDTSYPGEMGVYAFAAAQGYSPTLKWVYRAACLAYPLFNITKIRNTLRARKWGLEMGKRAELALAYRFEDNWHRPLDEIRDELAIVPAPTPNGQLPRHATRALTTDRPTPSQST